MHAGSFWCFHKLLTLTVRNFVLYDVPVQHIIYILSGELLEVDLLAYMPKMKDFKLLSLITHAAEPVWYSGKVYP